jgi:predicted acyl esterase
MTHDVAVRTDDGVSLSVNVYYPAESGQSVKASGTFPVLLEQTAYGKDRWAASFERDAHYFVSRGYILAVADMRGFGKSQGQAPWFGSRAGRDGAQLAQWAAHLDGANGRVGLIGCSYSGVIQYFTASQLGKNSPVKALAPFCSDSNFYRDITAFGGVPTQFMAAVRVLTAQGVDDDPSTDPYAQAIISEGTAEDAFYNDHWQALDVTRLMPQIVETGIPILSQSGWYDVFPGGNIDAYLAAQNALAHRPIGLPLRLGDRVSGRYQAIVGPWRHGEHTDGALQPLILKWFDTWLKDAPTGMADSPKPLHLFILGADRWVDSATYPLTTRSVSFRLSPGTMSLKEDSEACQRAASPSSSCSGTLFWAPEFEGTSVMKFESPPFESPVIIGGPGTVTLYVKSSRPEVELSATLFDVSSDGAATKVTDGVQLGSQRALDPATSWYAGNVLIRASHYFSKAKTSPIPVGEVTRLDIELVPTLRQIPASHHLQLKVTSQPGPTVRQYWQTVQMPNPLLPTPEELAALTGGVYTILFGPQTPSMVNLATASDADLTPSTADWGPGE